MAKTTKRHYWLREDFDEIMGLWPGSDMGRPGAADSSMSLFYPKSLKGATGELKLRGLDCTEADLMLLAERGVVSPDRGHSLVTDDEGNVGTQPSSGITYWTKEAIDAAANWLYDNDRWGHWTHFCWVANLRFGQAVRAHRYMCARHDLGVRTSFDVVGVVTVIDPPDNPETSDDYARVRFYPAGTKVEVQG